MTDEATPPKTIEDFIDESFDLIGTTIADKHVEVMITCVGAFLALSKQPNIDLSKLVFDLNHFKERFNNNSECNNAFLSSLIEVLQLELDQRNP